MDSGKAEKLMNLLTIQNQDTGKTSALTLYPEQSRLLSVLCEGKDVVICKSRQIGSSTLCLAYVFLQMISNPNYEVAIVAHKLKTSKKLTRQLKAFATQFKELGVTITADRSDYLSLGNGSHVDVLTAGTSTDGRGSTYHLILCSEAAYYRDSDDLMASLLHATYASAQVILESTASAAETHFKRAWEGKSFKKFFSPFEAHPNYKADPAKISDDRWEELKKDYEFTDRAAAAYWFINLEKINNDITRMLREMPIKPEHAWLSAEGRFINVNPAVREYAVHHMNSNIHIFNQPAEGHKYVFGVDTATGKDRDDSVVVVYDLHACNIAAQFCNNTTEIDGLVKVICILNDMYKPKQIYTENNGIGEATVQKLYNLRLPVVAYVAKGGLSAGSRFNNFLLVKQAIEQHDLCSDEHLLENCRSCMISTTKHGKADFSGQKDVIAALSFIFNFQASFESIRNEEPPRVVKPGAYDLYGEIKAAQRSRRRGY